MKLGAINDRLSPALMATLPLVVRAMASAEGRWWIITGAAAAMYGAEDDPADVDVLLGEADAARILPALGLRLAAGSAHARYRSLVFARWLAGPLPVEFMAGFQLDGAEVVPRTRIAIAVGDAAVFVPARDELAAMLRAFGRPKDLARAARLTS